MYNTIHSRVRGKFLFFFGILFLVWPKSGLLLEILHGLSCEMRNVTFFFYTLLEIGQKEAPVL
jgi:hypothetical protein